MSSSVLSFADIVEGQELPTRSIAISRGDLVRYAGASGDFNPIHYNDRVARDVGLPGVIAHGMFTMGSVVNIAADWLGDPGLIAGYSVRFGRPIPVPDPGEAIIEVTGKVTSTDAEKKTARVMLTVTHDGQKVLGKAVIDIVFH